jgi:MFS family permease
MIQHIRESRLKKPMEKRDGIFYGWVVLAIAFITLVLGYTIRNTFSVFYPTIVEEFGWGRGNTALMFSITIIVYGMVAPLAGGLVDRFGPRRILPVGAVIVGCGVALCSQATRQWHFYLFYGVMGATGLSLMGWTPMSAIVSNWFTKRRGLAFGVLAAGFGGSLVMASVVQFLISTFGWQIAYVIMGLSLIVIVVPLCGLLMYNSPREKCLLPDGIPTSSQKPENTNSPNISVEPEGSRPVKWTLQRAIRTFHFWLLFLIAFCFLGLAETIAIAHQVFFFRDVGYAPMPAAYIYSVFGVTFVIGNLCSFTSDRYGREKVFVSGCVLSAVAVCLLFLIKDTSQPWMAFLFAVLIGLGMGAGGPVLFALVADFFEGRYFGSILGMVVFGFSLGGAVAPWFAGFMHDKTGSYFSTYLVLLGSLLFSILLMWLISVRKMASIPRREANSPH